MTRAKAKVPAKRTKNGTSGHSAEDRRRAFVEAFLSNGGNATQAALAAGFSAVSAARQGHRLSRDVRVSSEIDRRRTEIAATTELNTENLFREVRRLAHSDPRNLMHADGRVKLPHELDDDTAAAIASFEFAPDGTIKYKFWDKNSAQERAAKILGVFERDNKQRNPLADLFASLSGAVMGVAAEVAADDDEGEIE